MLRSRLAIVRPRSAIVSPHRSLAYSRGLVRRGESGDTRGDALMTPEARSLQRTRAAERRRFGMPVVKILASGVVGMADAKDFYANHKEEVKIHQGEGHNQESPNLKSNSKIKKKKTSKEKRQEEEEQEAEYKKELEK